MFSSVKNRRPASISASHSASRLSAWVATFLRVTGVRPPLVRTLAAAGPQVVELVPDSVLRVAPNVGADAETDIPI
jgi:hypothetical protein